MIHYSGVIEPAVKYYSVTPLNKDYLPQFYYQASKGI